MDGRVRVEVRVRPGASRTSVGGTYGEALVVAVQSPPVDGRANEAVVAAVARAFGLRRGDVSIVRGASGRTKTLDLLGDESVLRARLLELLAGP